MAGQHSFSGAGTFQIIRPRGTSPYFNSQTQASEQALWEDLAIESIKIYGVDLFYIPRTLEQIDGLLREDDLSSYNRAIPIEMYVKSVDGFGGDGIFMKNFGYEIRQEIVFTVAMRTFQQEVGDVINEIRPREGDLIYFPYAERLFQIQFNEHLGQFYQLGSLRCYDLHCETFQYSSQRFNTGIEEIDRIMPQLSMVIEDYALVDGTGKYLLSPDGKHILVSEKYRREGDFLEENEQNDEFDEGEAAEDQIMYTEDDVIDWDANDLDPFSDGGKW